MGSGVQEHNVSSGLRREIEKTQILMNLFLENHPTSLATVVLEAKKWEE